MPSTQSDFGPFKMTDNHGGRTGAIFLVVALKLSPYVAQCSQRLSQMAIVSLVMYLIILTRVIHYAL